MTFTTLSMSGKTVLGTGSTGGTSRATALRVASIGFPS